MQIQQQLKISANQFSQHILNSIQYELKEYGQVNVDKDHIRAGITYKKPLTTQMKQTDHVTVEITKLEKSPFEYEATFDSTQGRNTIRYSAKDLNENECLVTYEEDFVGKDTMKKLNHKLMRVFYKGRSKRRIHYLLNAIEDHVLKGE
ncbi:DUF3284 domain-containing protein [Anaerorhabdus furcosa]|uniref:DUF3284 domain-containing protein n=1 Tax=Anaerorhabdus furcosa TaxID=118967 RepID=A0A1T4K7X1_9FIRM|nr:DUF3284 domain-containing protein [Anaerorhabdus furcosa]SJZ38522.1 protein of unknown function [Anaerorhabdus furcosa]